MEDIVEIGIDTGALERDAAQLGQTLSRIRAELGGLYESFRTLDAMWEGPANDAYRQQFRRDHADMEEICGDIQALIESMERAAESYRSGENRVHGIAEAIRI